MSGVCGIWHYEGNWDVGESTQCWVAFISKGNFWHRNITLIYFFQREQVTLSTTTTTIKKAIKNFTLPSQKNKNSNVLLELLQILMTMQIPMVSFHNLRQELHKFFTKILYCVSWFMCENVVSCSTNNSVQYFFLYLTVQYTHSNVQSTGIPIYPYYIFCIYICVYVHIWYIYVSHSGNLYLSCILFLFWFLVFIYECRFICMVLFCFYCMVFSVLCPLWTGCTWDKLADRDHLLRQGCVQRWPISCVKTF